jgi:hypothetical protein
MGMEFTNGSIINFTRDSGKIMSWMARELSHGVTVEATQAIIKTTKSMDTAFMCGQMAEDSKECGKTGNKMVMENT